MIIQKRFNIVLLGRKKHMFGHKDNIWNILQSIVMQIDTLKFVLYRICAICDCIYQQIFYFQLYTDFC